MNEEDEGKIIVTFIGRLIYHKGIKTVLETAKLLSNKKILFLLVGDGELRTFCENYIASNQLDNIRLMGNILHDELAPIYRKSDIMFFPSLIQEPFSMVVLESMMNQKAIIVSKNGGPVEILDNGECGYLVDPGDPSDCANKITILAENHDLRVKLGKLAGSKASLLNSDKVVEKVLAIYDK